MSIPKTNSVIHWIVIYPVDSAIRQNPFGKFDSPRASSPIGASEASRARTRERAAKPRESRLLSRASRACTFHDIPQWRACSQAKNLMSIKTFSNHVLNAKINWQLIIFYESKKIFVQLEKVIKFFLLRRHIKFCKQNTAMLVVLRENKLRKTSTVDCG